MHRFTPEEEDGKPFCPRKGEKPDKDGYYWRFSPTHYLGVKLRKGWTCYQAFTVAAAMLELQVRKIAK